jgi:uncharacterized protein YcbK (DUF882 family)
MIDQPSALTAMPVVIPHIPGSPAAAKHDGVAPTITRRSFIHAGVTSFLAVVLGPRLAFAMTAEPRRLRMANTHTLERVDAVYYDGAELVPEALGEIDRVLRDHRSGEICSMDSRVLDIVWSLSIAVKKPAGEFEIISGYRSPATNAVLRRMGRDVAAQSLHCCGQAIDLRMPGLDTALLRDAALLLRRGGVGYYRHCDFVHVDTGRVRRW